MTRSAVVALALACFSSNALANVIDDTFTATNTFESVDVTGGVETIFRTNQATVVDPGVEVPGFATLYDLDVGDGSILMTLTANDDLSTLLFGPGVFDRHYYAFESHVVTSASLAGGDSALINGLTVGVLPTGFTLGVADLFGTGIEQPINFPNGGVQLIFGQGTDISTLGVQATINFETRAVPEASALWIWTIIATSFMAARRGGQKWIPKIGHRVGGSAVRV